MQKRSILLCLSLYFVISSCSKKENTCPQDTAIQQPVTTDDGWQTSSLESENINPEKLQMRVNRICDSTYQNIHSVLIVKDGRLVFEKYFRGYTFRYEAEECKGRLTEFNRDIVYNLASVTKSITSVLVGIARDKGYINNVNDPLFKYFPEYNVLIDSPKG